MRHRVVLHYVAFPACQNVVEQPNACFCTKALNSCVNPVRALQILRKFLEVQGSPATKRVPWDKMKRGTRESNQTDAQTVRQAERREFGLLLIAQN